MIESYLLRFPLELIGAAVVAIATVAVVVGAIAATAFSILFAWVRGWTFISNLMWRGYDPHGQYPPLYRLRLSAVTIALARFNFRKIRVAWREAESFSPDDVTLHVALRRYLKRVLIDDD